MVKPGAVVIDVTTMRGDDGKQVGSLEWEAVLEVAGSATPVPGGVGPVTNVILLKNALVACKAQTGRALSDAAVDVRLPECRPQREARAARTWFNSVSRHRDGEDGRPAALRPRPPDGRGT